MDGLFAFKYLAYEAISHAVSWFVICIVCSEITWQLNIDRG